MAPTFKIPQSVLVVIHTPSLEVLLIRRADAAEFWQSVTGSKDHLNESFCATAQREADQTRGEGDSERNRIFAEAYNQDPNFFAFYRSMQAYETGLKSADTRMILSPTSEFFRFFGQPSGIRPQGQQGGTGGSVTDAPRTGPQAAAKTTAKAD